MIDFYQCSDSNFKFRQQRAKNFQDKFPNPLRVGIKNMPPMSIYDETLPYDERFSGVRY